MLTSSPGVYIMKNCYGTVIYVGKAKNLKNRVSQYFVNNSQHSPKVLKMVSNVEDFEYIVTKSEVEALILENNLIKQHKPKYNILLKDDKAYPFIAIEKNADYPEVIVTRRRDKNNYRYFGPFQSTGVAYDIMYTLFDVFGLYHCRHNFPKDIKKTRPCLNYHIKKCPGICTGEISPEQYKKNVERAINFLNGNYKKYLTEYEDMMFVLSNDFEFEKAAVYRDKIKSIRRLEEKQVILFAPEVNRDVIAYSVLDNEVCFSVIHIRNGKLLYNDTAFLTEGTDELMRAFIERYYQQNDIPKEIAVMVLPENSELITEWLSEQRGNNVRLFEAQKGENARLIDMCKRNASEKLAEKKAMGVKTNKLMGQIAQMLGLSKTPSRIEMYDVSNYGTDITVGGMVVYQDGRFKKSEYRTFNFDNVYSQNDYKYTYEMIERRLKRMDIGSEGFEQTPDIIFLDGGQGHINAVYEMISSRNIAVFGLVKDKKHRTRGIVGINGEVDIRTNPSVFKFFTSLQDEVHRFAITRMKNRKSKSMVDSPILKIDGIGETKYKALMDKFGSLEGIKNADISELEQVRGIHHILAIKIKEELK